MIITRHSVSHVHDDHKGFGSPADAVSPKHLNLQDVFFPLFRWYNALLSIAEHAVCVYRFQRSAHRR